MLSFPLHWGPRWIAPSLENSFASASGRGQAYAQQWAQLQSTKGWLLRFEEGYWKGFT